MYYNNFPQDFKKLNNLEAKCVMRNKLITSRNCKRGRALIRGMGANLSTFDRLFNYFL